MLCYVPPLIIPQLAEPRGLPGDRCLVPLPSTKSNPVLIQSTRLVLWFIATGINQAQGLSTWPEGGAALARRWCWSTLATQKLKAPRWESNKAIFSPQWRLCYIRSLLHFLGQILYYGQWTVTYSRHFCRIFMINKYVPSAGAEKKNIHYQYSRVVVNEW